MPDLTYYPARLEQASGKPRVLHISPLPPPWGGVAANLSYLLSSALTQAYNMAVLDTSRSEPREDVNPRKHLWHVGRIWRAIDLIRQARRAIASFNPDIVHIQAGGGDVSAIRDLLVAKLAQKMGCGVVFQQHFWFDPEHFRGPWFLLLPLYRAITPRCDAKLLSTPLHIEQVSGLVPQKNMYSFPNTCDPKLAEVGRSRAFDSSEPCLAIYIGRLSQLKGTYSLLVAASELSSRRSLIRFEIAGQGATPEDDCRIADLMKRHNLDSSVTLLGRISGEEKLNLFRRASILVYPTLGESLPVTLIEGMAAGLPIITTSVDYIPHLVVHGENGLVVSPDGPLELAEALLELANSPSCRKQMGLANYQKYKTAFALDVVADMLERIYEKSLERQITIWRE